MSISLDHEEAKRILFEEADAARQGKTTPLVEHWHARIVRLGELCPHGKSATVVAVFGTAALAKATDLRVDIYSLLDRGQADNSYSARSLADNVWAKNRARLNIDLGANGVNPLNNTPFIGKTHIDEISGVRNREGWRYFVDCMEELKALKSMAKAREALRGFIMARSRSLITPLNIDPQAGDHLNYGQLLTAIDQYVSESSEGGRRAQACAAAILDAVFEATRVFVGVINDPDRHAPLDISVTDGDDATILAVEVKDKPVASHHVIASIEKTVASHRVKNLGFIAVARQQRQADFSEVSQWAARHGVKATVFLSWGAFYHACRLFSPVTDSIFEGRVYRRILIRAAELSVDHDGLEHFMRIGNPGGNGVSTAP